MTNALYGLGRQSFLSQSPALDWDTDTIKHDLVTSGYTPSIDSHQYRVSNGSGNRVATSDAYGSKTVALGVADAANVTHSAVSGSQVTQITIFKDTGNENTDPLIALIDTATGLPVTPNGGDITVTWDDGANKIFKL